MRLATKFWLIFVVIENFYLFCGIIVKVVNTSTAVTKGNFQPLCKIEL